jgi:type IV pilus biogenesis protein CpaD/CtpE
MLQPEKAAVLKASLDMTCKQEPLTMKHNNSTLKLQLLTLLAAVLSGCATEPSATQKEFGSSVKHMISAQTYEPGDETTGLDGEKSRRVMDTYREDVAKPKAVEKQIINIQLD